jgi:hypothetical protein
LPFRSRPDAKKDLDRRATKQEWFELQQGTVGETGAFDNSKMIYPEISQGPKFSIDSSGSYLNKTVFSLATGDWTLLGLLNSQLAWFFFLGESSALRGGSWRLLMQQLYIERFPVPHTPSDSSIGALAKACQRAAEQRGELQNAFRRRIPDLAPGGRADKLPGALRDWWRLDFAQFQKLVKKAFRQDIPLAQRNDWQNYLETERAKVLALDAQIAQWESELDHAVYALFGLDAEEIALLESTLRRTPAANDAAE